MVRTTRYRSAFAALGAGAIGCVGLMATYQQKQPVLNHTALDVLVLGGTGLMGAPTARLLQARGHNVVIASRGKADGQSASGARPTQVECKRIVCDRQNSEEFFKVLTSTECPRIVIDYTAMNPEHIQTVLDAHQQRAFDHYVFISTNMVYPGGPDRMDVSDLPQPIAEEAADLGHADTMADTIADTYGGRKLRCEALLRQAGSDTTFPWTIMRPPAVVGPGCDSRHERLQRLAAGLPPLPFPKRNRPLARQPGRFRVAFAEDVAAAVVAAIELGSAAQGEAFNVASGEPLTLDEYVAAIAGWYGQECPPVPECSALRNFENQGQLDTTKAEQRLGFKPTPLEQWLPATVAWHAEVLRRESP